MLYHIRAELPDGTHRDFKAPGHETDVDKNSGMKDARARVDDQLRQEFGPDTRTEWRGMVVFVNREVPLTTKLRTRR